MTATALRKIAETTDVRLMELQFEAERVEAAVKVAARRGEVEKVAEGTAALRALREEYQILSAIASAGGWRRFILVPGGHVHRASGCSTLRHDTPTVWLPAYSGADEAELVEAAADAACTVCFPSAPVNRRSTIREVVEEREAREAEAAEKAAERARKADAVIRVPELRASFKTTRGAENEVGQLVYWGLSRRYMDAADAEHRERLDELAADEIRKARLIAAAIAAKVEGYDAEALLAKKVAAKAKELRKAGYAIPANAAL